MLSRPLTLLALLQKMTGDWRQLLSPGIAHFLVEEKAKRR